jgi:muramoyltetrapeptide carboxypeptidase
MLTPFAPASPADFAKIAAGAEELRRLGFQLPDATTRAPDGYFSGSVEVRRSELSHALERGDVDALVATRGGYGANYILDGFAVAESSAPKVILGYSDLTSLQSYFWTRHHWVGFYGPMLAAGFDAGAGAAKGYDKPSLLAAISGTASSWTLNLQGEALFAGEAAGRILGGCLTLVETTLGTPWEMDTRDSILLLEDRGMKPWQVDRALMHLKQAGKFEGVRGFVLGDFPDCDPPTAGSPTVHDVCFRILAPLRVPTAFGAPVGHTLRPMLTVPLGVRARLQAGGEGELEILESAVVP